MRLVQCEVETMMTVVATLKQQQRNVLAYMSNAYEAGLTGEPAPFPTRVEVQE